MLFNMNKDDVRDLVELHARTLGEKLREPLPVLHAEDPARAVLRNLMVRAWQRRERGSAPAVTLQEIAEEIEAAGCNIAVTLEELRDVVVASTG